MAASLCFQGFQSQLQVHQVWIQCIYTWCSCMLLYFLVEARTHKVILVNKNQLGQVLISPCYFNLINLKRAIILYMVVTKFNYLIRFHYYRNFGLCSRWTSLHHLALSLQHLVRVWSSVDTSKDGTTRLPCTPIAHPTLIGAERSSRALVWSLRTFYSWKQIWFYKLLIQLSGRVWINSLRVAVSVCTHAWSNLWS